MLDLSKPWPLGLAEKRWWLSALAVLVVLAIAFAFDHPLSEWAKNLPEQLRSALAQFTPYGESGWILYPAAALLAVTVPFALLVRWKLMRLILWEFAALYGFILLGVGLPSLATTIIKRIIGRGRPEHFDAVGTLSFRWNIDDWTYQSFPSGHATTAFALAAVLGFLAPRWFYVALAFAAAIALSRVTLGVHYPSDVVGGILLGLIGAYAVRIFFAQRRWLFEFTPRGTIRLRPMWALRRYLALKRRRTARGPLPNRP